MTLKGKIEIVGNNNEIWTIEEKETPNNLYHKTRFFITSSKGYNGYESDGEGTLLVAINLVKKLIKNN